MRILIVDDSKFMRSTIRKALDVVAEHDQRWHFTTEEASNGKEGLELLAEKDFDLVMTDWNMPIMNGLEFVTAIRRDMDLPIMMITTVGMREDVMAAIHAGINSYIVKPLDPKELINKLNQLFVKG